MTSDPNDDSNFRSGINLRLADGQVWSLPAPGEPVDVKEAALDQGAEATWDDQNYRAIVQAAVEAEDEGDLFLRGNGGAAITSSGWNYALDPDDFEDAPRRPRRGPAAGRPLTPSTH